MAYVDEFVSLIEREEFYKAKLYLSKTKHDLVDRKIREDIIWKTKEFELDVNDKIES